MTTRALLAQIHIAQKELGLEDDAYRDVLERVTGERSCAGLPEPDLQNVISEFRRLGWKGFRNGRKRSKKAYVRKVFALWGDLKRKGIWREPSVESLRNFVKKMTGCDDPEWLTYDEASKVIEALKKMDTRQKRNEPENIHVPCD